MKQVSEKAKLQAVIQMVIMDAIEKGHTDMNGLIEYMKSEVFEKAVREYMELFDGPIICVPLSGWKMVDLSNSPSEERPDIIDKHQTIYKQKKVWWDRNRDFCICKNPLEANPQCPSCNRTILEVLPPKEILGGITTPSPEERLKALEELHNDMEFKVEDEANLRKIKSYREEIDAILTAYPELSKLIELKVF